jgi:hypothetical protein
MPYFNRANSIMSVPLNSMPTEGGYYNNGTSQGPNYVNQNYWDLFGLKKKLKIHKIDNFA